MILLKTDGSELVSITMNQPFFVSFTNDSGFKKCSTVTANWWINRDSDVAHVV